MTESKHTFATVNDLSNHNPDVEPAVGGHLGFI